MKTQITTLLILLASSAAFSAPTEIKTRVANDYVLFDEIKEVKVTQSSNLPGILGSKVQISISGDLAVRGCQYNAFSIFLQPKSTDGSLNNELYNVTVMPMYENNGVEVSFLPCEQSSMGIQAFTTKLEVVVHEWLGWSQRKWVYTLNGISGVKLKHLQIIYKPTTGWSVTEI